MNMGTRWMATTEAPLHPNVKQALVDTDENGTVLVMRSMKNTERVFKNKAAMDVLEIEKEHPGDFSKVSHIIRGDNYRKVFQESGTIEEGVWSVGTVMGLIDSVVSCQELCDNIVSEAEEVIKNRLSSCVTSEVSSSSSGPTITPHYILKYTYVEDVASKRAPFRADHISLAGQYKSDGRIVMGGALADLSGASIVFRSKEDAEKFMTEDPYFKNGIVTDHQVLEWSVVV